MMIFHDDFSWWFFMMMFHDDFSWWFFIGILYRNRWFYRIYEKTLDVVNEWGNTLGKWSTEIKWVNSTSRTFGLPSRLYPTRNPKTGHGLSLLSIYMQYMYIYIYICNAWNVSSSTCKLYVVIRIHGPASGSREKSGPRIHFFSWTKKSGQVVQISWDLAGTWKDTHVFWCFFGREQLKPISGTMVDHADQLFHILNCFVFK